MIKLDAEKLVKDFVESEPTPQTFEEYAELYIKAVLKLAIYKSFNAVLENIQKPEILLEYKANLQRLESEAHGKTILSENH
mgnify:FL=1